MALEQAGVQLVAAGGDVYISTIQNATSATNKFVSATETGSGGVSKSGQIMIGALREVGKIATQAFLEAGKAAVSFVKDSISVAGDFEQGMHKFQAVAGDAVDTKGLEKFKDLFISLGKELPVSTSEVEQAAIEMVSGGIDPAIVQAGALRSTIQFAAASGLSLADAAATSAKFLAGWTDASASTADKVSFLTTSTDALTKAAAASSTTAAELRLGIFNVQGAAQALHAPFTDVVATLAELAPAFESSAQAGTALNVFMSRLEPQTDSAAGAMSDLGIITKEGQNLFFDATGNFLGMGNAAEVLRQKMSGLSDEQKISALHTLFGNDAMKVGNLLMQDGAAGLDAMKTKMDAANGVSATAALMQSGYNTALENAKGSVEALQITIGSALLPVLTDLMNNVIAPAVNTVTDFTSALFGNDEAFNKLSPSLQKLAMGISVVIADVQEIVGSFEEAGAGSSEFGESIGLLAKDLGLPGDLIEQIVFAAQNLVKWFQGAGSESSDLSKVITDLNGVWNIALKTITDVGNGYLAIVQAVLPIIQKLWADHGAQIMAFIKSTYDSVIQIITLAIQTYDAIVPPILNAIAGFFRAHAAEVELVLTGFGQAIGAIITGALDTLKNVFKLALDLIHGNWQAAWDDMKAIGQAQITAIQGFVTGFLNMIAGLFNTTLDDIARTWENNWNSLVDIVNRIDWGQVGQSAVDGIISGLADAWDSLLGWVKDKASGIAQAALDAIGAGSPATEFMPVGDFAVQGIMAGFQAMWPSLQALVSDLGDDLVNQAARLADDVQGAMADAFGATASIDRQKVNNLKAIKDLSEAQQAGVQEMLNTVEQEAMQMTDPKQAQEWFKMRSQQMIELARLNDQIQNTTDRKDKDRLLAQYQLINAANNADIKQFQANAAGGGGTGSLVDQLRGLLNNGDMPGILDNPIMAQLAGLISRLSSPPSTGGQTGGNTTYINNTTTNSMPVYSNNSVGALQQSWAVMQAGMI